MTRQIYGQSYGGAPAENYERFFVPAIGAPVANDLIALVGLRQGQRVLDVACGTGVVTRLAAERVGPAGTVAGLDVNPAMLAVARSQTQSGMRIDWYEASAESMPLPDQAFDIVLCQMGLQFVPDKLAALREMHRVLDEGGRAFVSLPGPTPALFEIMADALGRHLSPQASAFVDVVFSMHDADDLAEIVRSAGFSEVDVQKATKTLHLPPPADFLWQYIHSTPIAEAASQADESRRNALEREICERWQEFVQNGSMQIPVGMMTAIALK